MIDQKLKKVINFKLDPKFTLFRELQNTLSELDGSGDLNLKDVIDFRKNPDFAIFDKISNISQNINTIKKLFEKVSKEYLDIKQIKINEINYDEIVNYVVSSINLTKGKDINEQEIINSVLEKIIIPKPKEVDENKIIKSVIKKIKIPKINEELLVEKILSKIPSKEIIVKEIEKITFEEKTKEEEDKEFEDLVEAVRRRIGIKVYKEKGYVHGGGDTVEAGTGITITNVNGKKVISSTGGTWYQDEILTRTDGITYTLAHIPTSVVFLYLNGQLQLSGVNYIRNDATITMVDATIDGDTLSATYS